MKVSYFLYSITLVAAVQALGVSLADDDVGNHTTSPLTLLLSPNATASTIVKKVRNHDGESVYYAPLEGSGGNVYLYPDTVDRRIELVCNKSDNGSYPTYVGFIVAGVAVVFYGSNYVPVKKFDTGDGQG
jgi:hypothetical protein